MSAPRYLRALMSFATRRNRWLLAAVMALAVLSVTLEAVAMLAVGDLALLAAGRSPATDGRLAHLLTVIVPAPSLKTLLLVFAAVLLARLVVQLASLWSSSTLGRQVQAQLSSLAFASVLERASMRDIDEKSIGHYIALAGDEASRAGSVVEGMAQLLGLAALAVLYGLGILGRSPLAALALAIIALPWFIIMMCAFRRSQAIGAVRSGLQARAHAVFLDSLNGVRAVRAFGGESFAAQRYREVIFAYVRSLVGLETLGAASRLVPAMLLLASVLAVIAIFLADDAAGIDLAAAVTVLFFLLRLFPVGGQMQALLLRVASEARAGRDVTALAEEPLVTTPSRGAAVPRVREIALDQVSFSYPGRAEVLSSVSLTLRAGRSYALTGSSGSGKSTLLDLLIALRRPASGRILVDGRPIEALDPGGLRRRIILLSQQAVVFNDSVLANIVFGGEVTPEAARAAAVAARLDTDIRALPLGYGTIIGYQGTGLSGGQRQRLCLARALSRDPDALLLDECTAGLDAVTRDEVVANVLAAAAGRIVVFATHDPAVIARVDEVLDLAVLGGRSRPAEAPR